MWPPATKTSQVSQISVVLFPYSSSASLIPPSIAHSSLGSQTPLISLFVVTVEKTVENSVGLARELAPLNFQPDTARQSLATSTAVDHKINNKNDKLHTALAGFCNSFCSHWSSWLDPVLKQNLCLERIPPIGDADNESSQILAFLMSVASRLFYHNG